MGSIETPSYGLIRFTDPDQTIPPEERAFFAQSPAKKSALLSLPLHDFRTSPDITRGAEGLDVQGFTYITHNFSLSDKELFEGRKAEDIYAKECVELVLKLTGAKRGVVHNIEIRQKAGRVGTEEEDGMGKVPLKGSEVDKEVEKFPTDELFGMFLNFPSFPYSQDQWSVGNSRYCANDEKRVVGGREPNSGQEPSRMAHVDLTVEGLRNTLRFARKDMLEMAQPIFEAEARRAAGEKDVRVPRFAAYSVWVNIPLIPFPSHSASTNEISPAPPFQTSET